MSKIVMFGNQKGGVGKTQISIMAATALSQKPFNLKVAVIDLDNQKSVIRSRNYDLRAYKITSAPFDVFDYELNDLQASITAIDKVYDIIIIDVAGKLDNKQSIEIQEITKTLMYVDILFIPFVAGNFNLESTLDYFKFIKSVQLQRALQPRPLNVYGFINMNRARSRASTYLSEDLQTLQTSERLTIMQAVLNDYALFRESDTITSLYGINSSDSAKANFSTWLNELISVIQ